MYPVFVCKYPTDKFQSRERHKGWMHSWSSLVGAPIKKSLFCLIKAETGHCLTCWWWQSPLAWDNITQGLSGLMDLAYSTRGPAQQNVGDTCMQSACCLDKLSSDFLPGTPFSCITANVTSLRNDPVICKYPSDYFVCVLTVQPLHCELFLIHYAKRTSFQFIFYYLFSFSVVSCEEGVQKSVID